MKDGLMEGKVVLVTGSHRRDRQGDDPGDDPRKGAEASIHLATSPELVGNSGLYFERLTPVASSPLSRDRALQKRFCEI